MLSGRKVSVDDVEEFYAKIKQVADVNVKEIFITNNGFQHEAFTFAKSVGMMLITDNDSITLNIILHKANSFRQLEQERSHANFSLENEDILIQQLILRQIQRKLSKVLLGIFIYQIITNSFGQDEVTVPVLSAQDIEEFTTALLMAYNLDVVNGEKMLDWEKFGRFLVQAYELTISFNLTSQVDSRGHKILSACSFSTKTIEVDPTLKDTNRLPFLLAHEAGHFFLHNRAALNQHTYESFSDSAYNLHIDRHELSNPRN